jgi:hypothetical protein
VSNRDPKGYYGWLNVLPTASIAEIKAAFRQRAKELHPDHNKSPHAVKQFQGLNEAYNVLSDPVTRSQYDTIGIEIPQHQPEQYSSEEITLEPIVCSCCKKVTAQPRYVIFYEVKSFIVVTIRNPIQGIFCHYCAEKKVLRSTMITWFLGWWGFPWGLLYSPHAIIYNLLGGNQPNDVNARLLTYQAWVFATQGKLELARAVATDANELAQKIQPENISILRNTPGNHIEDEGAKLRSAISKLLTSIDTGVPIKRLKKTWSLLVRPFYIQGGMLFAVVALIVGIPYFDSQKPIPSLLSNETVPNPGLTPLPKPRYVRPKMADNGSPFPAKSSYISGYPLKFSDGYSSLTIDNSQNDSDIFIKLFSLDSQRPTPVRVFFILANGQFKVENVRVGKYDVRYRNLDSGYLSRSDPFDLEEYRTDQGVRFSRITLTLYKVRNGNMQTYPISEEEFP